MGPWFCSCRRTRRIASLVNINRTPASFTRRRLIGAPIPRERFSPMAVLSHLRSAVRDPESKDRNRQHVRFRDYAKREVSALDEPRRIANDPRACRHVMRHHAAGTNHRIVADGRAGENYGATTDPDMPANPDGLSEFKSLTALGRIARMGGSVDLDRRTNLCPFADSDLNHVKDHAVEIEEDIIA